MKYLMLLVPLLVMGCSLESPRVGRMLFAENCASCHGPGGRGDGPHAASLNTPPADLTRIAARRGGNWPMLEVMSIVDGYARRTNPREDMPVFGDFLEGDIVLFDTGNGVKTPTPTKLIALANYLESLQNPAPTGYVP
ncbi:cytochrome c [Aestuariicoccus sp. MJ-SS9]|uniref:c-type cytochrome n=1 Tax=Aestuariicoccus sp. MJ-SS9 TaxID=3079855 RepID=UPI00290D9CB2|nr:cytochrome c [Aestuariicoccus sp. MJ-SS9]MDU8911617.1 cytochrome c [Aestuariicoccus sp. MJ-SS9]